MNRSIIGHAVLARVPSSSNETRLATSTSPRARQNGGDAGFECYQSLVIYRSRHPLSSLQRRGSSSATAFADNSYPRKVSRSLLVTSSGTVEPWLTNVNTSSSSSGETRPTLNMRVRQFRYSARDVASGIALGRWEEGRVGQEW